MINLIRYFYRYTSLIYKIYKYIKCYNNTKTHDIVLLDALIHQIKLCGSVAIKFCQWSIPKLEVMYLTKEDIHNNIKPLWLKKLENFYENCENHDMRHTLSCYKDSFKTDITEDYEILDILGSGSIGQVYLLKNKPLTEFTEPKKYVMKIIHPYVREEIYYFRIYFNIIKTLPFVKKIIDDNFPFDINGFIDCFDDQSNFINESNNLLSFQEFYHDNKSVVIPRLINFSKDIIIMSYEEGISFDDLKSNKYDKFKYAMLLTSFVTNNQRITNLNHGDLHKGNWKIRTENGDYKIVIYDFGFSWRVPKHKTKCIEQVVEVFEKSECDSVDIPKLSSVFQMLIKDTGKEKIIEKYLHENIDKIKPWVLDPHRIFIMATDICIKHKMKIDQTLIQCIIILIQCDKIFSEYEFTSSENNMISSKKVYRKKYLDLLAYYKTNDIFHDYSKMIVKILNEEQTEIKSIFDCSEMPESIKALALKKI